MVRERTRVALFAVDGRFQTKKNTLAEISRLARTSRAAVQSARSRRRECRMSSDWRRTTRKHDREARATGLDVGGVGGTAGIRCLVRPARRHPPSTLSATYLPFDPSRRIGTGNLHLKLFF